METILDLSKRYTFADYLTWCDDKSRELLNGFIRMMSPAPSFRHQEITSDLIREYGEVPVATLGGETIKLADIFKH
jgi:Uma2 family endonuclease